MPTFSSVQRQLPARRTVLTLAAAGVVAAPLAAHDFWLVPGAFPFATGATVEVFGQTSVRFPTSVSPVALARVARAVIVSGNGMTTEITNLSHRGTSLILGAKPAAAGQYVVAAQLQPRSTKQTIEGMLRFLRLEGAADAASRLEREGAGQSADSVSRTDTKYAKTLVDVGSSGTRAFSVSSGQAIEFTPVRDPAQLRAGDTLQLRLMFGGQPVAAIAVHAGLSPAAGIASDSTTPRDQDILLVSDAQGIIRLPIGKLGLWNVRTIHVVKAAPASWETHWATFVFMAGHSGHAGH